LSSAPPATPKIDIDGATAWEIAELATTLVQVEDREVGINIKNEVEHES